MIFLELLPVYKTPGWREDFDKKFFRTKEIYGEKLTPNEKLLTYSWIFLINIHNF